MAPTSIAGSRRARLSSLPTSGVYSRTGSPSSAESDEEGRRRRDDGTIPPPCLRRGSGGGRDGTTGRKMRRSGLAGTTHINNARATTRQQRAEQCEIPL